MHIADITVVVSDVARSLRFYELLGLTFRPDDTPGAAGPCRTTGPGPTLSLHSAELARQRDPSHPGVVAGGTEIDLVVPGGPSGLNDLVARLHAHDVPVVKEPEDMEWGQRFAVVLDPDGHRIGLKASLHATG